MKSVLKFRSEDSYKVFRSSISDSCFYRYLSDIYNDDGDITLIFIYTYPYEIAPIKAAFKCANLNR